MSEETYLTVPEVAKRLHYNPSTIRKQCESKRIPSIQLGREYRIPQSWLDEKLGDSAGEKGEKHDNSPTTEVHPSAESRAGEPLKNSPAAARTEIKTRSSFQPRQGKVARAQPPAKKGSVWDDYDSLYNFKEGDDDDK